MNSHDVRIFRDESGGPNASLDTRTDSCVETILTPCVQWVPRATVTQIYREYESRAVWTGERSTATRSSGRKKNRRRR